MYKSIFATMCITRVHQCGEVHINQICLQNFDLTIQHPPISPQDVERLNATFADIRSGKANIQISGTIEFSQAVADGMVMRHGNVYCERCDKEIVMSEEKGVYDASNGQQQTTKEPDMFDVLREKFKCIDPELDWQSTGTAERDHITIVTWQGQMHYVGLAHELAYLSEEKLYQLLLLYFGLPTDAATKPVE